jgi:hypothetical protein
MKRLDKPTMNWCDNLLIIEKKTDLKYNILLESRLSESLTIKTLFSCLPDSQLVFIEKYIPHIHPLQETIFEGDN